MTVWVFISYKHTALTSPKLSRIFSFSFLFYPNSPNHFLLFVSLSSLSLALRVSLWLPPYMCQCFPPLIWEISFTYVRLCVFSKRSFSGFSTLPADWFWMNLAKLKASTGYCHLNSKLSINTRAWLQTSESLSMFQIFWSVIQISQLLCSLTSASPSWRSSRPIRALLAGLRIGMSSSYASFPKQYKHRMTTG